MKKFMLLAIGAMIVLGIGAGAAHAQAAESLPASQVMGQETASALQQTLTILGTVLNNLNARIDTNTLPANPTDINNVLTGLHGALLSIHSTIASLESQTRTLADNNALNGSPATVNAPQPSGQSQVAAVEGTQNSSVASASLGGDLKKFLWPTLIVLVVVAGILLLRKQDGEERTAAGGQSDTDERVRPEEPETFSYLPTITDY